jgi:hypothetical protein
MSYLIEFGFNWALVNAGRSSLLLLWIKDGLDNFEAVEQQIIDLAGTAGPLSSRGLGAQYALPMRKHPTL